MTARPRYRQAARHLITLKDEGLLREAAACNFDTEHLRELIVDESLPLTANQVQFSLVDLRPENGMLDFARKHGIKLACFGTVDGGLLSKFEHSLSISAQTCVAARAGLTRDQALSLARTIIAEQSFM